MWWLWLFPIVGAGLLVGTFFMTRGALHLLRHGKPGVAQVVDYRASTNDGSTTYEPILRLIEPHSGVQRGMNMSSSERKWKIGTKLKVKISPDDPKNFTIDSYDDAMAGPAICGTVGGVFLVIGLVFIFLFNGPRDEVIWEPEEEIAVEELEQSNS